MSLYSPFVLFCFVPSFFFYVLNVYCLRVLFNLLFLPFLSTSSLFSTQAAASMRSPGLLTRAQQKVKTRTTKAAATPIASEATRKVSGGRHSPKREMPLVPRRTTPRSWSYPTKTTQGRCSTEPYWARGQRRSSSALPQRRTDTAPTEAKDEKKGRPIHPVLSCLVLVLP